MNAVQPAPPGLTGQEALAIGGRSTECATEGGYVQKPWKSNRNRSARRHWRHSARVKPCAAALAEAVARRATEREYEETKTGSAHRDFRRDQGMASAANPNFQDAIRGRYFR